jgi:hypothetical protein
MEVQTEQEIINACPALEKEVLACINQRLIGEALCAVVGEEGLRALQASGNKK